ncbi:hypothetical protein NKG94_29425 [Micromonospora sp. M12]
MAGSGENARLTTGPAEYNTFLGWPLLLVAVACAIWVGRRRLVLACVAAGLVMGALSLGPQVVLGGTKTGLPGPYALIGGLPVVDGALPMRFALALLPIVATLLVLAVDRALRSSGRTRRLVPLAVGVALLPIFPTPLPTIGRPAVPEFITGGHWRQCVSPGGCSSRCHCPRPRSPGRCAGQPPPTPVSVCPKGSSSARTGGVAPRRWAPSSSPPRRCWRTSPGAATNRPSATSSAVRPPATRTSGARPAWR